MSIHQKDGARGVRYQVRWREGERNRQRSFPSLREAQAFELSISHTKRYGAFAPQEPSAMLLRDFIERWMTTSGIAWAKTTLISRASLCDRWIDPFIGHVPLRELGRSRVRDFRAEIMAKGSSPTNTNNVMRCLSAALGVAESEGLVPVNPCLRLGAVKQGPRNRQAVPEDVVQALIDRAKTPRDRAIIGLCAYAALRPAEILSLTVVDLDSGWINVASSVQYGERVTDKNSRPRSVPISDTLKPLLAQAASTGSANEKLVAPNEEGGFLDWHNWSRDVWRPIRDAVAPGLVFYSLRHTAVSRWIGEGNDVVHVAEWAGHSVETCLKHYAHLWNRSRRPVVRTAPASAPSSEASAPLESQVQDPTVEGATTVQLPAQGSGPA